MFFGLTRRALPHLANAPPMLRLTEQMVRRFKVDGLTGPTAFYHACKAIDGYQGAGTFNLIACRVYGFYFQTDRQPFYDSLSDFADVKAVSDTNYYLLEGDAREESLDHLVISFRVFDSTYSAPGGRLPMPLQDEKDTGVHDVAVIGWDDATDSIVFQNSWGRRWGEDGIGYISKQYFERYMNDVWLARRTHIGPIPAKWERLQAARSPREFVKIWELPNPRWRDRFRHKKHGHQWVIYETVSPTGARAEVIEIRRGYGLRVGWAHVFHLRGDQRDTSVIKELFVWPAYRGNHYGTLLEWAATERACNWNSRRIELFLHDVDDFRAYSPQRVPSVSRPVIVGSGADTYGQTLRPSE
jgi:GNAT superfamily N-acetyltransferase